jgi:hypothetical protein
MRREGSEGGEAMSMLGSQADRLRLTADVISERGVSSGDLAIIEIRLREAADTIESLRKQVAKCQIAELKADYDTSRYFYLFGTPERAARTLRGFCEQCRFVELSMALIEQNGAKLGERIVRCKDCERWPDDCDWNNDEEEPGGFCAWGERRGDV